MLAAMKRHRGPAWRGFTLIEVLIVIALVAIVLGLAGPSFVEFIRLQRLRSVNAQLVTDINLARSEAISRNVPMHMRFQADASLGMTCYIIYTSSDGGTCDCTAADGARCTSNLGAVPPVVREEVRAVQVPMSLGVRIAANPATAAHANATDRFVVEPRSGTVIHPNNSSQESQPFDYAVDAYLDTPRTLRNFVGPSGRVKVCKPLGSLLSEKAC